MESSHLTEGIEKAVICEEKCGKISDVWLKPVSASEGREPEIQ